MNLARRAPAAVALVAAVGGALVQASRLRTALRRGRRLVAISERRARDAAAAAPDDARSSVLVIGDSTALGVGVDDPRDTIVARLRRRFPRARVIPRAQVGARIADAIAQCEHALARGERHALVVLMIGGNDLLGLPSDRPPGDPHLLAALAARLGERAVWIGCANVGASPLFLPPLSWWLRWHGRRVVRGWAQACARHGVHFLDFWLPVARDPYARRPDRYYAADLVHPSGASHAVAFRRLAQVLAVGGRYSVLPRSESRER